MIEQFPLSSRALTADRSIIKRILLLSLTIILLGFSIWYLLGQITFHVYATESAIQAGVRVVASFTPADWDRIKLGQDASITMMDNDGNRIGVVNAVVVAKNNASNYEAWLIPYENADLLVQSNYDIDMIAIVVEKSSPAHFINQAKLSK